MQGSNCFDHSKSSLVCVPTVHELNMLVRVAPREPPYSAPSSAPITPRGQGTECTTPPPVRRARRPTNVNGDGNPLPTYGDNTARRLF